MCPTSLVEKQMLAIDLLHFGFCATSDGKRMDPAKLRYNRDTGMYEVLP